LKNDSQQSSKPEQRGARYALHVAQKVDVAHRVIIRILNELVRELDFGCNKSKMLNQ